jgi:GTPase Era involved in 16S rRNA processing
MSTKTPKTVKANFDKAKEIISTISRALEQHRNEQAFGFGVECVLKAQELRKIVAEKNIPDKYKVAVIGRFKAGKSSFVNELLGTQIAGENTSPETAAVTTFTYAQDTVVNIKFLDEAHWKKTEQAYQQDPGSPDAARYKAWADFQKGSDFNLYEIQDKFIKNKSHVEKISVIGKPKKEQEKEIRNKLKEFTTGTKPYHCLVETIEIETPSNILNEGIVLIDTPGLDDVEKLRVELTRQAVQDVDAIIFLLKSGTGYGQSEKDFFMSLLRKGNLKQLVFVVTMLDHTYDQHVKQSKNDEENPNSLSAMIEVERMRLKKQISETFSEVENEENISLRKFDDQLNQIDIFFTSAQNHRDHKKGGSIPYPLQSNDPGGMNKVTQEIFNILSTSSRVAAIISDLHNESTATLNQIITTVRERKNIVRNIRNKEEVANKLITFRSKLDEVIKRFVAETNSNKTSFEKALADIRTTEKLTSQLIASKSREVLSKFQSNDISKHWKTRRSGYWGYLHQFQDKTANAIFPIVSSYLTTLQKPFEEYINHLRESSKALSINAAALAKDESIDVTTNIDVSKIIEEYFDDVEVKVAKQIELEQDEIISVLDNFLSEDAQNKIEVSRDSVTTIYGRGTTNNQNAEVESFYESLKEILSASITTHFILKSNEFSNFLKLKAAYIPEKAVDHAQKKIAQFQADLHSAIDIQLEESRIKVLTVCDNLEKSIGDSVEVINNLLSIAPQSSDFSGMSLSNEPGKNDTTEKIEDPKKLVRSNLTDPSTNSQDSQFSLLLSQTHDISNLSGRPITLIDGQVKITWESIFPTGYFQKANSMLIVDPFLSDWHQLRNLLEVVNSILSRKILKDIFILTKPILEEAKVHKRDEWYKDASKHIYDQFGASLYLKIDSSIHDRFVVFDSGVVMSLGRGLDIYKPSNGERPPAMRPVRGCVITTFSN